MLNNHYARISTDASYINPSVKYTVNNLDALTPITEWKMFEILDSLRPTATGPDNIPAWFLGLTPER